MFLFSRLNIPNGPAHNPSGAGPQPLGSKLTAPCEQAPEGLWAYGVFSMIQINLNVLPCNSQ